MNRICYTVVTDVVNCIRVRSGHKFVETRSTGLFPDTGNQVNRVKMTISTPILRKVLDSNPSQYELASCLLQHY